MSNTIQKTVQRSNFYMVLAGVVAILIAAIIIYLQSFPYFYGKFAGPFPITTGEIINMSENETLYWRELNDFAVVDTGYYEYTYDEDTGRTISTDAWFGAILLTEGRWMLVRTPNEIDESQRNFVGGITRVSGEVAPQVLESLRDELPNVKFVPVMLDVVDNQWGWYAGGAAVVALLLAGIWALITGVTRMGNPTSHPTFKRLGRMGSIDDVVQRIESELTMGDETVDKIQLTRNFLIHKTGSNFEAMRYDDMIWLYKMVQSGRYGKTFIANFCDKHGHQIRITTKDKQVDAMLRATMPHAPWALAGYTDDINKAWNRDREQLIQAVEQRKSQIAQQGSL